jgi:hypothetical protein
MCGGAVLLVVALVARGAVAQQLDPAHAGASSAEDVSEGLIAAGIELRRAGDDKEALSLFARAAAVHPSARARAQVGLAQQALGRWIDAERSLAAALEHEEDPWVERYKSLLQSGLAAVQSHLAWLDVTSSVAGASLYVNGELAGTMPLGAPVRVVAGLAVVELRAPGYVAERRERDVEGNARVREAFALRPVGLPPIRRALAWASAGTAGALLAGGIVANVVRETNVAALNDDSQCLYGSLKRYERCGHYLDTSNTALTLTIAGYSAAAVAAVASAVLFLWPTPRPRPATGNVECSLGAGFWCAGEF